MGKVKTYQAVKRFIQWAQKTQDAGYIWKWAREAGYTPSAIHSQLWKLRKMGLLPPLGKAKHTSGRPVPAHGKSGAWLKEIQAAGGITYAELIAGCKAHGLASTMHVAMAYYCRKLGLLKAGKAKPAAGHTVVLFGTKRPRGNRKPHGTNFKLTKGRGNAPVYRVKLVAAPMVCGERLLLVRVVYHNSDKKAA